MFADLTSQLVRAVARPLGVDRLRQVVIEYNCSPGIRTGTIYRRNCRPPNS